MHLFTGYWQEEACAMRNCAVEGDEKTGRDLEEINGFSPAFILELGRSF